MKSTLAIALCFLTFSAFAGQKQGQFQQDAAEKFKTEASFFQTADTLLQSATLLSAQNKIYRQRLDSIQSIIPLNFNEHVLQYIELYAEKRKQHIGKMLGLSEYYFPIFEKSLREVGVPDELKFLSVIESSLNPNAVSRSGAVGPWQFMYTTAKGYGLVMDNYVDERKDPVQASFAAAHYLEDAYGRIGDWLLTIAAYNCGTGAVTRAIERSGGEADFWKVRPYLPRETQNYVPAFIATVYVMNYHTRHNISPKTPEEFNPLTDIIDVNRTVSLASIAKAANLDLSELLVLNPWYKKQIVNGSAGSPKRLVVPAVNKQTFAALYEVLNQAEAESEMLILASTDVKQIEIPATHRAKEGQTLLMVANQYGLEVQDLKVYNYLQSTRIVPGQLIRLTPEKAIVKPKVAPSKYLTYIVKAGDTLSEIAEKFSGTTTSKIKALNGLKSNSLKPGMKLKINKG